ELRLGGLVGDLIPEVVADLFAAARNVDLDRSERFELEIEDPDLAVGLGVAVLVVDFVGILGVGRRLDLFLVGVARWGESNQGKAGRDSQEEGRGGKSSVFGL